MNNPNEEAIQLAASLIATLQPYEELLIKREEDNIKIKKTTKRIHSFELKD